VDGYLNVRYISVCYPVAAAFAVIGAGEVGRAALPGGLSRRVSQAAGRLFDRIPGVVAGALVVLVAGGFVYAGARDGAELEWDPAVYALDGRVTTDADGTPLSVRRGDREFSVGEGGAGALYYEAGWLEGETARFDGWAIDPERGQPADAVLVFVDGALAAEVSPSIPVDLSELGLGSAVGAGFSVGVPWNLVRDARVRLVALVSDDMALELNYPAYFPYW
jgi:hypothetical protein